MQKSYLYFEQICPSPRLYIGRAPSTEWTSDSTGEREGGHRVCLPASRLAIAEHAGVEASPRALLSKEGNVENHQKKTCKNIQRK